MKVDKEYVVTDKTGKVLAEGNITASSPDTVSIDGNTFDKESVVIKEKK